MSFDLKLVNNDLKISSDGSIDIITDTPKLRQDIIKIILTPQGSLESHPWYGCTIDDISGQNFPGNIIDSEIRDSIVESLQRLQKLQKAQSVTQRVSLAEIIEVIQDVHAERDIDDGRKINILVSILSKRLSEVSELFTIIS